MGLMVKCQLISIGFMLSVYALCGQKQIYNSKWQSKNFSSLTNSQLKETMRFYDNNTHLQYNITNDNKNLYICFKEADENFQMKIIHAGMQINIDTSRKQPQAVCLIYPLAGNGPPKMPIDMKPMQEKNNNKSNIKKQILSDQKEMKLLGFKPPINGKQPLQNKYDISVDISWDSLDNMYYRAVIPFGTFYKETLQPKDSNKIFHLTFILNAMDMPGGNKKSGPPGGNSQIPGDGAGRKPSNDGNGNNGPPSGDIGNMGNGGPPPGGGDMQNNNSVAERNEIKVKIHLAVK